MCCKYIAFAQTSVFEQDTVVFNIYAAGNYGLLSSVSYYDGEPDTVRGIRSIYIDSMHVVHFHDYESEKLVHNNKSTQESYYHIQNKEQSPFRPFKVIKKGKRFYYKTIADGRIIFKASLKQKDTIKQRPFFVPIAFFRCSNDDNENLNMVYERETFITYKGEKIECYQFSTQTGSLYYRYFSIYYTKIFFEKESLLPIYMTNRHVYTYIVGNRYVSDFVRGFQGKEKTNYVLDERENVLYPQQMKPKPDTEF